jgi:thioredoxin-related protein
VEVFSVNNKIKIVVLIIIQVVYLEVCKINNNNISNNYNNNNNSSSRNNKYLLPKEDYNKIKKKGGA